MCRRCALNEFASRNSSKILGGPLMVTLVGATALTYGVEVRDRCYDQSADGRAMAGRRELTVSKQNVSMACRASDSEAFTTADHDPWIPGIWISTSLRISNERRAVLKAIMTALTPAGINSERDCDVLIAAAAKDPVQTPKMWQLPAVGYGFDQSSKYLVDIVSSWVAHALISSWEHIPNELTNFADTKERKLQDGSSFCLPKLWEEVDQRGKAWEQVLLPCRKLATFLSKCKARLVKKGCQQRIPLEMEKLAKVLLKRDCEVSKDEYLGSHRFCDWRNGQEVPGSSHAG